MMEQIVWKDKYKVGNVSIDNEHEVFVLIIQKIIETYREGKGKEGLQRSINELYKYAEFHFCSEENVMFFANFPNFETHRKEHQKLLIELRQIMLTVDNSEIKTKELISFLMKWFVQHTLSLDKDLAKFLN
jgi:hemerythrin